MRRILIGMPILISAFVATAWMGYPQLMSAWVSITLEMVWSNPVLVGVGVIMILLSLALFARTVGNK